MLLAFLLLFLVFSKQILIRPKPKRKGIITVLEHELTERKKGFEGFVVPATLHFKRSKEKVHFLKIFKNSSAVMIQDFFFSSVI